jgi:arginine decarboxylase
MKKHIDRNVIPFHVPGHKYGSGLEEFKEFVGENVLKMDLNAMGDLDDACNPIGVIAESEQLLAKAFGAQAAYFLINGTSAGVQAMIISTCSPGDHIILPRNAHKSTLGGIILSGAVPIYVQPEINEDLGIAMGVSVENVRKAIKQNPHAKAVFVINPTYYGAASDLKSITRIAHRSGMTVLVDEAHGSHMSFHDDFPLTAMEVGADMSAASMHKTGGAMTQTSVLLVRGDIVDPKSVKQVLNLTYTTSASYVLMCSIDAARKQLATKGSSMLDEVLKLSRWARDEINQIEGLYAPGKELIGTSGCHDFDETKLTINVRKLGLTGYEVDSILINKYNIQMEFADMYNLFAIISLGDKKEYLETLVNALKEIAKNTDAKHSTKTVLIPFNPQLIVSPRDAFYSPKKSVRLDDSIGEISGEMIMAYPPGIPIICMGERITKDIVDYVKLLKEQKSLLQGTVDPFVEKVLVLGR